MEHEVWTVGGPISASDMTKNGMIVVGGREKELQVVLVLCPKMEIECVSNSDRPVTDK